MLYNNAQFSKVPKRSTVGSLSRQQDRKAFPQLRKRLRQVVLQLSCDQERSLRSTNALPSRSSSSVYKDWGDLGRLSGSSENSPRKNCFTFSLGIVEFRQDRGYGVDARRCGTCVHPVRYPTSIMKVWKEP
jgi:hypothetical protein